jgi:hypothetical protein
MRSSALVGPRFTRRETNNYWLKFACYVSKATHGAPLLPFVREFGEFGVHAECFRPARLGGCEG